MDEKREILFSIIIPVYQAKGTLSRCVLSCLNQKYIQDGELEIILVDDGSTDGSSELCDELAAGHQAVSSIHSKNFGVSHARNLGIEAAKGRFIVFVDSDDEVKAGFLENMLKYADESTALVDETKSYESTSKINGYQYIDNSILNANTHVWGKLFSRAAIKEGNVRFPEGLTIGEDLLFLLDFAMAEGTKRTIRLIDEGDYIYVDNPEGAMNKAFKKSYLDQIVCWRQAEERLITIKDKLADYSFVTLAVDQIMTALLVAGKVALAEGQEGSDKDLQDLAVSMVKEQISHALKKRGAFSALSIGYKIKTVIFNINPRLYLALYARHKA